MLCNLHITSCHPSKFCKQGHAHYQNNQDIKVIHAKDSTNKVLNMTKRQHDKSNPHDKVDCMITVSNAHDNSNAKDKKDCKR